MVRQLKFHDITESRRKRPLQQELLLQIIEGWDLDNLSELIVATMFFLAHNGLLRSGELTSGLTTDHILWDKDKNGFILLLLRTKTVREGPPIQIPFWDFGGINAVSLMRKLFEARGLWRKHHSHLFPARKRNKQYDDMATPSSSWFRVQVKKAVAAVGLDPRLYSGHSFRAGGATDLFVAKTPYYVIKKRGRWLSDAAMIYYRDDDDVLEAVCNAFRGGQVSK